MQLLILEKYRNDIIRRSELNIHRHKENCEICQHTSSKITQVIIKDDGYEFILTSCSNCFEMISTLILNRIKKEYGGSFKSFCLKNRSVEEQFDWYLNTVPYKRSIKFDMKLPKHYYNLEIKKPTKNTYQLRLHTLNDNTPVCLYCGELLYNGGISSIEHIIPKSHYCNEENTILGTTCHECNRFRRSYDLHKILRYDHWFLKYLKLACGGNTNQELIIFIKSNQPMFWLYFKQSF